MQIYARFSSYVLQEIIQQTQNFHHHATPISFEKQIKNTKFENSC